MGGAKPLGNRSANVSAIYFWHARPMIVINLPSSVQHCFTLALPSKISFTLILRCSALCRACSVMHCSTCFLHLRTLLSLRACHLRKSLSEFIFPTIVRLIYSKHRTDVCGVCVGFLFYAHFFLKLTPGQLPAHRARQHCAALHTQPLLRTHTLCELNKQF